MLISGGDFSWWENIISLSCGVRDIHSKAFCRAWVARRLHTCGFTGVRLFTFLSPRNCILLRHSTCYAEGCSWLPLLLINKAHFYYAIDYYYMKFKHICLSIIKLVTGSKNSYFFVFLTIRKSQQQKMRESQTIKIWLFPVPLFVPQQPNFCLISLEILSAITITVCFADATAKTFLFIIWRKRI